MISLESFINKYVGQSVLYNKSQPALKGQCVQYACFYVEEVWGLAPLWRNAAEWWYGELPSSLERVRPENIQRGDLVLWDRSLAGTSGAGHIAIMINPKASANTFISSDSNWGGLTAHLVSHNWDKVIGGLRRKQVVHYEQPKGDLGIMNEEEARNRWYLSLHHEPENDNVWRPFVGQRVSVADKFIVNTPEWLTQNHVIKIAYPEAQTQLANMQEIINQQNQTITNLSTEQNLTRAKLNDTIAQLAEQNVKLATAHDTALDAQKQAEDVAKSPAPDSEKVGLFVKIISALLSLKK